MSGRGHTKALRTIAVALVALALVASGCGKSSKKTSTGGGSTLFKQLPASIQKAGALTVGSDVSYAPVEFYKEGTKQVQGIDLDLCNAMSQKLGLSSCTFQNTTCDGIIPALLANRFDIIMSAMSDTKEREAKIDFIDYFNVGTSILVAKGNPQKITSLDDLCGKTIGIQKGTTQEDVANKQKDKCKSSGKDLTILTFETDTDAQQALKAGRSVADMNDFPVAAYTAKTSGGGNDFEVVGSQIDAGPYGIGVRKADTQLRSALQAALKAIIDDGTYDKILADWNVTQGALKTAAVNGA